MSDYDGLKGCEICGNDTTGRLCRSCAEQEAIDNGADVPVNEADERGDFEWAYGFFGGGDPRDFTPDYEMCTPEEIERWKADVALAEAGDTTIAPPAGQWVFDQNGKPIMHILAPKYGMGTYKFRLRDEDVDALDFDAQSGDALISSAPDAADDTAGVVTSDGEVNVAGPEPRFKITKVEGEPLSETETAVMLMAAAVERMKTVGYSRAQAITGFCALWDEVQP